MFPNSPNIRLRLININNVQDSIGNNSLILKSTKEVIGISFSITSSLYFESKLQGIRFKLGVKIQSFLYDKSQYADINNTIYKIERTFISGQFIELYLVDTSIIKGDIIGYT